MASYAAFIRNGTGIAASSLGQKQQIREVEESKHGPLGGTRCRLVVFDVDGTLTQVTSIWQYVHRKLGTWSEGRVSSMKYWRGEISYEEWARLDAMMWRGRGVNEIIEIVESVPYVEGAKHTFSVLRNMGMKIAVASAGLSLLVDRIVRDLGADLAVANQLIVEDGILTGDVKVNVSLRNKGQVIRDISNGLRVGLNECVVVGDYSFDFPKDAGLKLAFNPKDQAAEKLAHIIVRSGNLEDILKYISR